MRTLIAQIVKFGVVGVIALIIDMACECINHMRSHAISASWFHIIHYLAHIQFPVVNAVRVPCP